MTNQKKEGQEYIAMQAPEELHMWVAKHPWPDNIFNEAGVQLIGVTMHGELVLDYDRTKNTKRSPLCLDTGVEINGGFVETKQALKVRLPIRTTSVRQFNDAMRELSLKFKITTWETKKLDVYRASRGVILKYNRISPNQNGASLYMESAHFDGKKRSYKEMLYSLQDEFVGSFRNDITRCTIKKKVVYEPECLIEKKQRSSQTILRKR